MSKPHIPQPRPLLEPMPRWMVLAFALAIPVDVVCIAWIVYMARTT